MKEDEYKIRKKTYSWRLTRRHRNKVKGRSMKRRKQARVKYEWDKGKGAN